LCLVLPLLPVLPAAQAQLSLTQTNTPFTVDFDSTVPGVNNGPFAGAGFTNAPAVGQLDSDAWAVSGWSDGPLAFGGTRTTGDYARGAAGSPVSTGGLYAFSGTGLNGRALGIQPGGGDFDGASSALKLRLINDTGLPLHEIRLRYDGAYRNDQARTNSVSFAYSPDDVTYTTLPAMGFTSGGAGIAGTNFVGQTFSATLTGLDVQPGDPFYLRWSHASSGSGSRDELALDDIVVVAIPEPGAPALLAAGAASVFIRRRLSRRPTTQVP
jgi:hypothetical protein